MSNRSRLARQLRPARTLDAPQSAIERLGDVGTEVTRRGPRIGAQVFSVFDARPIGARDFMVTLPASLLIPEGFTGWDLEWPVPAGSVAVLRRFLIELVPQPILAPGVLTVSVRRNGAPIAGLDSIRHGRVFDWTDTYAVFGEVDTVGVFGRTAPLTPQPTAAWITLAGTLLPSTGLPTPLEVGHGTPRVRIAQTDERGIE